MIDNKSGYANPKICIFMKGKLNVVVDSLSRIPTLTLMKFHDDWKLQLAVDYSKKQFACDLFDGLIHDYT